MSFCSNIILCPYVLLFIYVLVLISGAASITNYSLLITNCQEFDVGFGDERGESVEKVGERG